MCSLRLVPPEAPSEGSARSPDPPHADPMIPMLDDLLVAMRTQRGDRPYTDRLTNLGRVFAPHHVRLLREHLARRRDWTTLNAAEARTRILAVAPPRASIDAMCWVVEEARERIDDRWLWLPLLAFREAIREALRNEPDLVHTGPFLEAAFVILLTT